MTGPMTPTKGTLRVCRGVMLAVASSTLAIAAHGVAGGGLPDTALTLLLVFGVSAVGIAVAGKRYSLGAVAGVLGTVQLVTHLLLSFDSTGMDGMAGMNMATAGGLAMVGAHAVAVVLTSVLVVRADAVLFALARSARRMLPMLVAHAPVIAHARCPRPAAAPRRDLAAVALCRINARRGPPVSV
ncbi:MAG TPA: hypothetical protein VGG05_18240 [Pseudonocardiaceae bacterium]